MVDVYHESTTKESLVEHKFVIILEHIKVKTEKPVDCILKYTYDLISMPEIATSPPFKEAFLGIFQYII